MIYVFQFFLTSTVKWNIFYVLLCVSEFLQSASKNIEIFLFRCGMRPLVICSDLSMNIFMNFSRSQGKLHFIDTKCAFISYELEFCSVNLFYWALISIGYEDKTNCDITGQGKQVKLLP